MSQKTVITTDQTITLFSPLTTGDGKTLNEITMRVPKRKDIGKSQRHSKDPVEAETFLFHLLTGLTMEDIGELTLADSNQLSDMFRRFYSWDNNEPT